MLRCVAILCALCLTTPVVAGEPTIQACDLSGKPVNPLADASFRAVVLVFVATDCPISNRYVPTLNALLAEFGPNQIAFFSVYPDRAATSSAIRAHQKEYDLKLPPLLDSGGVLVKAAEATVTPEVAVYLTGPDVPAKNRWIYRGRIDDTYASLGVRRPIPGQEDLKLVLQALLTNAPLSPVRTRSFGCYIGP